MKESFLAHLICPVCFKSHFQLQIKEKNEIEIREGSITCTACHTIMGIEKGIIDAFMVAAPQVVKEAGGWEEIITEEGSYNEFSDDWLLSLPFLKEDQVLTVDQMHHWHLHGKHFFRFLDKFNWQGKTALEIGAGRCWGVAELSRRGAHPVGLDILTKKYIGLESADSWISKKSLYFERIKGDMHHLPVAPNTFDFVLTTASLHHTDRLDDALAEIARVLKPRGHALFINEPVIPDGAKKPDMSDSIEVTHGIIESRPYYSEWMAAFEKAGFFVDQLEMADGLHVALRKSRRYFQEIAPNGDPALYGDIGVSPALLLELRFLDIYRKTKSSLGERIRRAPSAPQYYWRKFVSRSRD